MMTCLPIDRLRRIDDKRFDDIHAGALEGFEAGWFENDGEEAISARTQLKTAQIRIPQDKGLKVAGSSYKLYQIPLMTIETVNSPTHVPAFSLAVPEGGDLQPSWKLKELTAEIVEKELRGRRDKALDLMFRRIDTLLRNAEFEKCNELLDTLDVSKVSTNLIVGFLSITFAASDELPARSKLVTQLEEKLKGNPLRSKILAGLKR